MRARVAATLLALLLQGGCGYVGPVQPPSPMVPLPISDLSAIERGDQIYIGFTAPAATSDEIAIKHFSDIDLRMGPEPTPFDYAAWEQSSRQYVTPTPPAQDPDDPKPFPIHMKVPVSEWQGKSIAVAVRTAVRGDRHFSGWSNRIHLDVVPPLDPPVVKVEPTRDGYRLTWDAKRPGLHYQVLRTSPTDKTPLTLGTAERSEFVDTTSQWDTHYKYTVVAQQGTSAESLPSTPMSAFSEDKFAPSVPADITALAGPDSIELSWTRSPESDLKGYRIYRSVDNSPLKPIGDLSVLPAFSDKTIQHGKIYRYAVTAIDNKDNESEKSRAVDVVF